MTKDPTRLRCVLKPTRQSSPALASLPRLKWVVLTPLKCLTKLSAGWGLMVASRSKPICKRWPNVTQNITTRPRPFVLTSNLFSASLTAGTSTKTTRWCCSVSGLGRAPSHKRGWRCKPTLDLCRLGRFMSGVSVRLPRRWQTSVKC